MARDEKRILYRNWIAHQIKQLMRNRKLDVKTLSDATGIRPEVIYAYLNSTRMPSAYTVAKMCIAMDVDEHVMLRGVGEMDKVLE